MAMADDEDETFVEKGEDGWPIPTEDEPDEEQLCYWVFDSIVEATDGCTVEPDGVCEHGHPSWLLKLGLI
jgi:hypothetical protein